MRHDMASDKTVPVAVRVLDGSGNVCADLTPNIKRALSELQPGEILEVVSDDLVARVSVPAWSRLTGNEIVETIEEPDHRTRFFIKHK